MELSIAFWSPIALTGIIVVLTALKYFLRRSEVVEKPSTDVVPQPSSPTPVPLASMSQNRRKNARKRERRRANKTEEVNVDQRVTGEQAADDSSVPVQPVSLTDEEEFEDPMDFEERSSLPPATHVEDEQKPSIPLKPPPKPKSSPPPPPPDDESNQPSKPHACVAPVKQNAPDPPPGFAPRLRPSIEPVGSKRKSNGKTAIPLDSAARKNDFVPSKGQQQRPLHSNGYSSESDLTSGRTSRPTSTASPCSASEATESFSAPRAPVRVRLDELLSVFETNSFSSDELQLLLDKATSKHPFSRPDWQRFNAPTTTAKNEKIIERLIEENNRHQLKLLAIELQAEQTRARELAKTNAELDQTMRQLQQKQQQQQQSAPGLVQYQQTVHSYQMQLKRLSDENSQLVQQLTVYSMMPGTLNELKQQQQVLLEQMRHFNLRSSALEQEITDGERASKNAAEIYQKADAQKQDRIEQMVADLNRYKKIDKDLTVLRQKHQELEKNSPTKLKELTEQRDELEQLCHELRAKVEQFDQLKRPPTEATDSLVHDLLEVKAKHELLQQRNCKLIEQFQKLTEEQIQSS